MPRKQTMHLYHGYAHDENPVWCDQTISSPSTDDPGEATCEDCLKAAATYGRNALARAYILGLVDAGGKS